MLRHMFAMLHMLCCCTVICIVSRRNGISLSRGEATLTTSAGLQPRRKVVRISKVLAVATSLGMVLAACGGGGKKSTATNSTTSTAIENTATTGGDTGPST